MNITCISFCETETLDLCCRNKMADYFNRDFTLLARLSSNSPFMLPLYFSLICVDVDLSLCLILLLYYLGSSKPSVFRKSGNVNPLLFINTEHEL